MSSFLLVIFGAYCAMHAYAFLKARSAFPFGAITGALIGLFMACMVFSPVMVRIMERQGYDILARFVSYIGYSWMGMIFLFFSLSLLTDIFRIVVSGVGLLLHRDISLLALGARAAFLAPVFLALGLSLYGYFSALAVRPERIVIATPKIPAEIGQLRIVQISDVHVGLIVRKSRLERISRVIREADPDILVSTGDLVDGQLDSIAGLADILREVKPRYGKYAVTGNHEFYAGLSHALDFTYRAGFTVLRGESADIPGVLTITGFDDPTGARMGIHEGKAEDGLLSGLSRNAFILVLKHQPLVDENSHGRFDLQLSGHTHHGQIFPFRFLVQIFYPRTSGLYDLGLGSSLYVSRGTGTWGPPLRLLSPPEVTVIDLVTADDAAGPTPP